MGVLNRAHRAATISTVQALASSVAEMAATTSTQAREWVGNLDQVTGVLVTEDEEGPRCTEASERVAAAYRRLADAQENYAATLRRRADQLTEEMR